MSLRASKSHFDRLRRNQPSKQTEGFYTGLGNYLKSREDIVGAKALGQHILDHKPISFAYCRPDTILPMMHRLAEDRIPFVSIVTQDEERGFLIATKDADRYRSVKDRFLKDRSTAIEEKSCNDIFKESKNSNPTILMGLSDSHYAVFRRHLHESFAKLKYGHEEMADQTHTVAFKNLKQPVALALSKMLLQSSYEVSLMPETTKRDVNEMNFVSLASKDFWKKGIDLNETPLYIVGSDRQYMKLTERDCEIGYVKRGEVGKEAFVPRTNLLRTEENFFALVCGYSRGIPDRTYTRDESAVLQHFDESKQRSLLDPVVPSISVNEVEMGKKAQEWVAFLHPLLSQKMEERYPATQRIPSHIPSMYIREARMALQGITDHTTPPGYTKDEMEAMQLFLIRGDYKTDQITTIADHLRGLDSSKMAVEFGTNKIDYHQEKEEVQWVESFLERAHSLRKGKSFER